MAKKSLSAAVGPLSRKSFLVDLSSLMLCNEDKAQTDPPNTVIMFN